MLLNRYSQRRPFTTCYYNAPDLARTQRNRKAVKMRTTLMPVMVQLIVASNSCWMARATSWAVFLSSSSSTVTTWRRGHKLHLVEVTWNRQHLSGLTHWLLGDAVNISSGTAWCRLATSNYLNQYWPISTTSYSVTRPEMVKAKDT